MNVKHVWPDDRRRGCREGQARRTRAASRAVGTDRPPERRQSPDGKATRCRDEPCPQDPCVMPLSEGTTPKERRGSSFSRDRRHSRIPPRAQPDWTSFDGTQIAERPSTERVYDDSIRPGPQPNPTEACVVRWFNCRTVRLDRTAETVVASTNTCFLAEILSGWQVATVALWSQKRDRRRAKG